MTIMTTSRRKPRRSSGRTAGRAPRPAVLVSDPPHAGSLTALAGEALRAGVVAGCVFRAPSIPRDTDRLCGDPDDETLADEFEIGRLYGVPQDDPVELRTSWERLARRDRHRAELRPIKRHPRASLCGGSRRS
jgi:hypothetical protein